MKAKMKVKAKTKVKVKAKAKMLKLFENPTSGPTRVVGVGYGSLAEISTDSFVVRFVEHNVASCQEIALVAKTEEAIVQNC